MRKTLLASIGVSIILSGAMGTHAGAMTPAPLSAIGPAAQADAALVHRATVVCGNNGCVPVQTKRVEHPKKLPGTH
jgi:hypothetical protein